MLAVVMNGIVSPTAPAKISPTIIKIAEVIPFFAAIPKSKPSTNSKTIGIIELRSKLIVIFFVSSIVNGRGAINGYQ